MKPRKHQMTTAPAELELILFETRRHEVERAVAGGIGSVIVDWEWRDKQRRQRGADTEINHDSPQELERLQGLGVPRRYCRVNRFGPWTREEVATALGAGATHLLLPMVERREEVEAVLEWAHRRKGPCCRIGVLVETEAGVEVAPELAQLPLDRVYVGLNDLAISRRSASLFDAVADGTVEALRHVFSDHLFGFGGVTVVGFGVPVPCRLLLAEMARLGCAFSFLRRSFKRDIVGRDLGTEVERIRTSWRRLRDRTPAEVEADRLALEDVLAGGSRRVGP